MESQHGNHVVQKIVEMLPPEHAQFVTDELLPQIDDAARHNFGCRIVQRILEHGLPSQTAPILNHVLRNLFGLCREQYGNYVVQHVILHGRAEDRAKIFALITSKPMETACHKYGSNVVEKCLLEGQPEQRASIINALFGEPNAHGERDPRRMQQLLCDRFAGFVVGRILDVADPQLRAGVQALLQEKANLEHLKKSSQGKSILSKLGVRLPEEKPKYYS